MNTSNRSLLIVFALLVIALLGSACGVSASPPAEAKGDRITGQTVDYMPLISELPEGYELLNEKKLNQQGVDGIFAWYFNRNGLRDNAIMAVMFSGTILSDERTESTEDSVNSCAQPDRIPAYLKTLDIDTPLSRRDAEQTSNTENLNVYAGSDETFSVMAACFNNRNFAGVVIVVGMNPETDLSVSLLELVKLVTDKLPRVDNQIPNQSSLSTPGSISIGRDNPLPTADDLPGLSYFEVHEVITHEHELNVDLYQTTYASIDYASDEAEYPALVNFMGFRTNSAADAQFMITDLPETLPPEVIADNVTLRPFSLDRKLDGVDVFYAYSGQDDEMLIGVLGFSKGNYAGIVILHNENLDVELSAQLIEFGWLYVQNLG